MSVQIYHSANLRSRRAFAITETELNVMAALAMAGLKRIPKNGYRIPAATGTHRGFLERFTRAPRGAPASTRT